MFIPYDNSGSGQYGSKNLNILTNLSPNMSGNVGLVTNTQESLEFYNTLSQNAAQDPLWSQNETELQNTPKIIEHGRCLHCKHWVGDKG